MSREVKEFPKMVYSPTTEAHIQIKSNDDLPEGWLTWREKFRQGYSDASADAAAGAVIKADGSSQKAADDAQSVRDTAAAALALQKIADVKNEEAAHRDKLKAYLTEHNVEYKPQMGTAKLEDLSGQLREHLAAAEAKVEGAENAGQEVVNDSGE